jgi:hypothetical protein
MAQITNIITIHEYNKMTAEQRAAIGEENRLAVVQQDWEEARINAAIAAMQAFIGVEQMPFGHIAGEAVKIADALVTELQKKGGDNGKSN